MLLHAGLLLKFLRYFSAVKKLFSSVTEKYSKNFNKIWFCTTLGPRRGEICKIVLNLDRNKIQHEIFFCFQPVRNFNKSSFICKYQDVYAKPEIEK